MSEPDIETLTAYHEAGHALMAVVCGGRIVHASITPPDDDGLARFGESIVQWPAAPVREIEMAELKVSLAGPIAELSYDGGRISIGECPEFAADWQRAQLSARELKTGQQRLALLVATERELWGFFESDNVWAATAAIADLLLAHDTIEHVDVADTWQFWKVR